jgi:hypothetical protein
MAVSVSTIAERTLRRLNVTVVPIDDSPQFNERVPASTIATMALVELGVIASDEPPIASDQTLALDKLLSVHAALDAQRLVWWDSSAIPRAFVEEYVKLTAAQAASSFGKAADPATVALFEGRVRRRFARPRGRGGRGGAYRPRGQGHRAVVQPGHPGDGGDAIRDAGGLRIGAKMSARRTETGRGRPGHADAVHRHRAADER